MFPETLIVCINTHGIVPTDIEDNICKPIIQKMKYPIKMFKINASTYGIPFISSLNNTEMICRKLNKTVNKSFNTTKPHDTSCMIKKKLEMLNRNNTSNIIKDINKSTHLNLYANYSEFMFNIVETKQHAEYVEKLFIKFDDIQLNKLDIIEEKFDYFNTARMLNVDNMDLFEILTKIGYTQTQISLTDLIDVLYNMTHMKNLIIIDMTCSTTENNKRNDRMIRRELLKYGLY